MKVQSYMVSLKTTKRLHDSISSVRERPGLAGFFVFRILKMKLVVACSKCIVLHALWTHSDCAQNQN